MFAHVVVLKGMGHKHTHIQLNDYSIPPMEKPQTYSVRCVSCGYNRQVSHNDGRTAIQTKDTKHTPESMAKRMQKRAGDTCPKCDEERFGVSPKNS
jgi:Zn ribbon nucleic-acid-binding protein